jgi:hypothetical protein
MIKSLEFRLSQPLEADAPTYCGFSVWVDGGPVWPIFGDEEGSVDIFIDDILDHLADFWLPLTLRQTYPLSLDEPPERPSSLGAILRGRWLKLSESAAEAEQAILAEFEAAHNFATCFAGLFGLPPLWLLRERNCLLIDTEERLLKIPYNVALNALAALGDAIAARLKPINSRDWSALIAAWDSREDTTGAYMLELSAGISRETASELVRGRYLAAPSSLASAANDDDEILIAARMAGALPVEEIKRVITLAKSFKQRPAPRFKEVSSALQKHIDGQSGILKPHELGEAAARFLRSLVKNELDVLDVRALASSINVEIKEHKLSLTGLQGLAIFGRSYGPGVLLNRRYYHLLHATAFRREAMLRYTLAHELCHLLLDGAHPFTAVDVLKGRMSPALESRAQSFAGEMLLPTKAAASIWEKHGRPRHAAGLEAVLSEAVETYQITRSVAAWKVEHAAIAADVDLHAVLYTLARYR